MNVIQVTLCSVILCCVFPCPVAPRYLSSQYLADSSLCMDVSQYDFSTGTKSYPKLQPKQQVSQQ